MNIDILKPLLSDELFAQLTAALEEKGKDLLLANIAGGEYIPKAKFDEKLAQIKQLTADLDAKGKLIEESGEKLKTVDGLQQQIDQLTKALADKDSELKGVTLEQKIKDTIRGAKAKNPDVVLHLLKRDQITQTDDGKVQGLTEQLDALKKGDPYLFEEAPKPAPRGGFSGHQDILPGEGGKPTNADVNSALRAAAGRVNQ